MRLTLNRWMVAVWIPLFLLAACRQPNYATPELAVRQYLIEQGESLNIPRGGVTLRSTHYYGRIAVVLYENPHEKRTLYFKVAEQEDEGWVTKPCCDGMGDAFTNPTPLLDFGTDLNPFNGMVVYGRRLAPEVHRVEGLFETGTIVSEVVQGEFFALFAFDEVNLCELRVYDVNDQLIERSDPNGTLLDAPRTNCKVQDGTPGITIPNP